jgi:2-polyprenyl-3-methyl-5-hydroxy-6-metoxy-1,4-benzoquinol methylase
MQYTDPASKQNNFIEDYAEFSGMRVEDIQSRVAQFHDLVNEEWHASQGEEWREKAQKFYGQSQQYILDLLYGNPTLSATEKKLTGFGVFQFLEKLPPQLKMLEFGAGLGGACQLFHERGYDITYLDIPGLPLEFSRWRFAKYHLPIKTIVSNTENLVLEEKYNFIISDAVFEHLAEPIEVVSTLVEHLFDDGFLLLLIDTVNVNDAWPMHQSIDFTEFDKAVIDAGARPLQFSENRIFNLWKKGR